MLWVLIIVALIALAYYLFVRPMNYWKILGIEQGSPVPIFGHLWGTTIRTKSFAEIVLEVYNISTTARYTGMYQFMLPTLVLRDLDLIKQITVKDFDHFTDHRPFIPAEADSLFGNNLFALQGQKWREMRATLSPAFTSSKMKYMFNLITKSGERFIDYFDKQNGDVLTIEMKDTFTRFTNDVIANTAFGVECDSMIDRENEFYMMGKDATDFSGFKKNIKFFGYFLIPFVYKLLKISLFSEEVTTFFKQLIKQNIESREKHGIVRPDLIHLLLEARKNNGLKQEEAVVQDAGFATVQEADLGVKPKIEITDLDITAQSLGFFFAGFDTVSSLMCFLSYELGVNQEIQAKLIQEIDEVVKQTKGKVTYEAILSMKYMDMVVSESLRKWPNAVAVDRICTKPYTIEPTKSGEKPIHLKVNDLLWLPIFGLHRDPEHFPDPERYDPERFSDENKGNIKPYAYIPFGSGPRNCIGSRFALLETKILIYHLLSKFEIVPNEKTQIPLVLNKNGFNMTAEGGFWFGLKRRVK